jgi:hypothetical protein
MSYKKTLLLTIPLIMITSFFCSSEKNTNSAFNIQLIKGEIVGNTEKLKVNKDEIVKISFNSDSSELIHIHGYDIEKIIIPTETSIIEFQANATGRFRITAHKENDSDHLKHAALFESTTLIKGEKYSYQIPIDMENRTFFYHNHMNHNNVAEIIVSSNQGLEGIANIKINENVSKLYNPNSVIVKPGAIVEWEVLSDSKVRITSGLPPTEEGDGHGERLLLILEVYP